MIAAVSQPESMTPQQRSAIGAALAGILGSPPPRQTCGTFELWGEAACVDNRATTLFFGRIDNAGEMARELSALASCNHTELYARALAEWGDEADLRLIGSYCAITVQGRDRLRLVRSPWTAPPLHFSCDRGRFAASPLLSALFAAGWERRIDWDHLADQLAYDHHDCEPHGWYEGINRVPLGCRVICAEGHWTLERYYDPVTVPSVRHSNDTAYVERAEELLGEAARCALDGVRSPGIFLSAGLDSSLVATALLSHIPDGKLLNSFTFGPVAEWDGYCPPGTFGEERDRVRQFAAMHPRIRCHFPEPAQQAHDYRLRDLLALCEAPSANVANIGIFHPLYEAAADAGCDTVFTGMLGNFTISLDGDWAAAEALRKGRLSSLAALIAETPEGEDRSRLRRFLALAVLPNLPAPTQRRIRRAIHPERHAPTPLGSLLAPGAVRKWRQRAQARGSGSVFDEGPVSRSRSQAISRMWASADSGEDIDLGMQRLHGVETRDVTAYRPLIEFCHGLPTNQLRRGACDRFLARRMAIGLMPEAQRLEPRQARHNVDWHARMSARRRELIAQVEALEAHGRLAETLDLGRMTQLLEDWPVETPQEPSEALPRAMGLTRALTAAAFVSHAERRNDF